MSLLSNTALLEDCCPVTLRQLLRYWRKDYYVTEEKITTLLKKRLLRYWRKDYYVTEEKITALLKKRLLVSEEKVTALLKKRLLRYWRKVTELLMLLLPTPIDAVILLPSSNCYCATRNFTITCRGWDEYSFTKVTLFCLLYYCKKYTQKKALTFLTGWQKLNWDYILSALELPSSQLASVSGCLFDYLLSICLIMVALY